MTAPSVRPPIGCGLLSNEYFFLSTTGCQPHLLSYVRQLVRHGLGHVSERMRARCPATIQYYRRPDTPPGAERCVLDPDTRLGELDRLDAWLDDRDDGPPADVIEVHRGWIAARRRRLSALAGAPRALECPEQLERFERIFHGAGFGKIDFVVQAPFHHAFWSADFQRVLVSRDRRRRSISAVLAMPTYAVESVSCLPHDGRRRSIMALTFVTYPTGLVGTHAGPSRAADDEPADGPRRTRAECLHELLRAFFPDGRPAAGYPRDLRVALTLSPAFPVLMQARFTRMGELDRYLERVRDQSAVIGGTSTMVFLDSELDEPTRFRATPRADDHPEERYRLLVRLSGDEREALGRVADVIAAARRDGEKIAIAPVGGRPCHGEPYFWDWVFDVTTTQRDQLVQMVAERLRALPEVEHTAMFPLLDDRDELVELFSSDRPTPAPRPIDRPGNRGLSELPVDENVDPYYRAMQAHPGETCYQPTGEAPSVDPLNHRLYNLKFQYLWLIARVRTMQRQWHNQSRTFALRPGKTPDTFRRLIVALERDAEVIERACDKQASLRRVADRIEELGKRRGAKQRARKRAKRLSKLLRERWKLVRDFSQRLQTWLQKVNAIEAAFNERAVGWQLAAMTEPTLRGGGQSAVTYTAVEAAGRLFRHYCSRPRTGADPAWSREEWKGIVTSRGGDDYLLIPQISLLQLPADFSQHSHVKLVPIAHEAAHQVMYMLRRVEGARAEYERRELYKLAIDIAWENPRKRLTRTMKRVPLWKDEFFADIVAGLCAGPAYFRSLKWLAFDNAPRAGEMHPPTWCRLELGRLMARTFRWTGSHTQDPWGIGERTGEHLARHVADYPGDDGWTGSQEISEPAYYLLRALREEPRYLKAVEAHLRNKSHDFLFYPVRVFASDDERRRSVAWVNHYCEAIGDRLMYDGALEIDAPLRYIAAASELPVLGRPTHPVGRILLSLYYSEARVDEMHERLRDEAGLSF